MLTLIFVPIAAAIFTLGANTVPPSSNLFVPEICTTDEWQKLINDGIEIAATVKNPVERNKLLQFLQNLKEINQESPDISESNSFYVERQRIKWEEIASKLKSRLASAQQNLPESNDKALIVRILQDLNNHATKAHPSNPALQVPNSAVVSESWNPSDYVRNVYIDEWIEYNLAEVKKQLENFSPSVFISYAWGPMEKLFVQRLADHLSLAGINVRLDKWHNGLSTSIHTGFVTELESVDYIIVVGSKLYGDKCRQKKNNVVIAEARIIAERHKRQPGRILPVLLADNPKDSFPAFLRDKVFANFSDPKNYTQQLSVLILTTCKYAEKYEKVAQTLQNMIAGAERIQQLSAEGLTQFNP